MTLEELEFLQRHPRFPETLVPVFLSELKRQRAIKEGAKRVAEHSIVRQWLSTNKGELFERAEVTSCR
jgi:hypothetical protein